MIKFGVCADLHIDIVPDSEKRLQAFLEECERQKTDFIIHLGDFCYPPGKKRCDCRIENMSVNVLLEWKHPNSVDREKIIRAFQNFSGESFHVIGNHDLDFSCKTEVVRRMGMPAPYYSFERNGIHFIVLDCNFYQKDGRILDFAYGNYFESSDLPYLSEEQLRWLEEDISTVSGPLVLFSHQRLCREPYGIRNWQAVWNILNAKGRKDQLILAINGHNHEDGWEKIGPVWYWDLNGMSNQWLGEEFAWKRYDDETEEAFPSIKYTAPYKDCLFSIVEINEKEAVLHERQSEFLEPGPEELGCPCLYTPVITGHRLKLLEGAWIEIDSNR